MRVGPMECYFSENSISRYKWNYNTTHVCIKYPNIHFHLFIFICGIHSHFWHSFSPILTHFHLLSPIFTYSHLFIFVFIFGQSILIPTQNMVIHPQYSFSVYIHSISIFTYSHLFSLILTNHFHFIYLFSLLHFHFHFFIFIFTSSFWELFTYLSGM